MDGAKFDRWTKVLAQFRSRRAVLHTSARLAGIAGLVSPPAVLDIEAKKRKKRKSKRKKRLRGEACGTTKCTVDQFCCDDGQGLCCAQGAECCSPGERGSCCEAPNRCARIYGDDASAPVCCSPGQIWEGGFGHVRCCPPGSSALTGIDIIAGPCCPHSAVCREVNGRPHCCNNPAATKCCLGTCCAENAQCCGDSCCDTTRCNYCEGDTCIAGCKQPLVCRDGHCQCPESQSAQCGRFCCTSGDACCNPASGLCCTEANEECCNNRCFNREHGPFTPCGDTCCQRGRVCCEENGGIACKESCD